MLNTLISEEIDGEPLLRDRLVAAYLLGFPVHVPAGEVVGGSYDEVPLCEAADQVGCLVSYASYRASAPPADGAIFGRGNATGPAACVNPAALVAGEPGDQPVALHPYFLVQGARVNARPFADPAQAAEITTPWVTYPDFVRGECSTAGNYTFLALTVEGDPADPRTDDIGGDLPGGWGMHLVDVSVAMGDIEALVASQAEAYAG